MTNSTTSPDQSSAVLISEYQPGIVLMTMDLPGKGANILSDSMFEQLDEAISPLLARDDIEGLILYSAKPKIFVAGADLVAINKNLDYSDDEIVKFCDDGRRVMAKFCQTTFPTVAAIHGACVGGGLELALWCDRRIATDDRRTILGLPEAKLGLVPGWGGTVRVARIAESRGVDNPIDHQIDLVTSGRIINAAQAAEIGIVDEVTTQEMLLAKAAALLKEDRETKKYIVLREQVAQPLQQDIFEEKQIPQFSAAIGANKEIYPFAPTVALEHMLRSIKLPMKEACDSESLAMAQVWGSPASRGLINFFFLGEHGKKSIGFGNAAIEPHEIMEVGIVGAGAMGSAIAASNLKRRKSVLLLDSDDERLKRVVDQFAETSEAISPANDYADFKSCDLVIETVVEKKDVKMDVLKQIESGVEDATTIATNTSAISISELAAEMRIPNRFCGIHFCHPEVMALVEVIQGLQTSDQTIANATRYVRSIGKTPIVVRDRAGFVVNRLLSALLKQALRLLTDGYSITAIDGAMREFGFRAGPFEMVDIIGADTCSYAGFAMWDAGLTCVSESLILPRMVKLGWLGRKTDKGFYQYSKEPDEDLQVNPDLEKELSPYILSDPKSEVFIESIAHEILAGMTLEAARILDEGIVADFRDIDLAVIHGFSFPAEHGGILFWADEFGIARVVEQLEQLAVSDDSMNPNGRLLEMANTGAKFYQA